MMTTHRVVKKGKSNRKGWALAWGLAFALDVLLGPISPALAQRRRAEPEANPSFTQDMSAPAPSGGPVDSSAPPSAIPRRAAAPKRRVKVGAQRRERRRPAAPVNPLDTRIVVRVKNAPLATFLDTISAQAKVNFIITEGLEKKRITAFLQNVTVREALQILLEIKGLTYQRIGRSNTYVVSPRAKGVPNRITRIYTLNYIPLVPIDAGTEDFTAAGNTPAPSASGGAPATPVSSENASEVNGGGDLGGVAIINVLRSVLSKRYGSIAVDARTNALIITDIPETFPQVEQILAELDRKAPQVMIEAQIVEINSDRAQQLGLEWGGANGELASFTGGKRDTTFPLNMPKNVGNFHFFDPVNEVISGLGGGAGAGEAEGEATGPLFASQLQTGILDLTQLSVVLRALVSRAEARFLGKPKILTLNNKPALIQVAQNEAVAIRTASSQDAGGSSQGTEPERFSTGLKLKVTPQVNREGFITMFIETSFTNAVESKISSQSNRVFDPATRGASTLVRVKNGQTLVLGGLLESRESKAVRKVPFLGYIPLIGWLFTSNSSQRTNTDLVIFITPTIVTD
jgi:type II secretory pathway component GspD/PulD (secretin)